ncbi:MAG: tyrosine-type recombinase/integrase [Lachnospiraceae bacterium]|nr:tyrosine-type recombinase/integrase [Lachnospiraceae bacterium]
MAIRLSELIVQAVKCLEKLGYSSETIKVYRYSAFAPLERQIGRYEYVDSNLIQLQEIFFLEQYENGVISRHTFNWRIRGIRMIEEVYDTGDFIWKVFSKKTKEELSEPFKSILASFILSQKCSIKRRDCINSICQRFLCSVVRNGVTDISDILPEQVQKFMTSISKSRSKSMDDVIYALKSFFRYLCENGLYHENFWMLLASPRCRDHHVRECVTPKESSQLLEEINRLTEEGKRDFAVMSLAIVSGLRASDIASLKLEDIDWLRNEIRLIQGKTFEPIILPVPKPVLQSIADYILNGRPQTESRNIFIRHQAPFVEYHDGVSIACIFRKYQKKAGITHNDGDGKTLHGLRRGLGTEMTACGVPVDTVAQVLGHRGIKATKQYISADMRGMQLCVLGFDSLGGDNNEPF